jgi:hypothetical protein
MKRGIPIDEVASQLHDRADGLWSFRQTSATISQPDPPLYPQDLRPQSALSPCQATPVASQNRPPSSYTLFPPSGPPSALISVQRGHTTQIYPDSTGGPWFPTRPTQLVTAQRRLSYPYTFIDATVSTQTHTNKHVQAQQQSSSAGVTCKIIHVGRSERIAVLLPEFEVNLSQLYDFVGRKYGGQVKGKTQYLKEPPGWYAPFDHGVDQCLDLGLYGLCKLLYDTKAAFEGSGGVTSSFA